MASCADAAVVSQYSKLKFVDSPQSPPLPSSVVECRGGRSGYAVNQHSQLRFNVKIPPKSAHMEANFPPRPSPVVIEKGIAAVQNTHTSVSSVKTSAHGINASPQASLQPRSKLLVSDGLALASWLAKRDLERNRISALAMLQAGSRHSLEMEEEGEEEEERGEDGSGMDPLEDGPSQPMGRGQYGGMQPFPVDLKVEGRFAKGMSRNVHFDTSTGVPLSSNRFKRERKQPVKGKGGHPASGLVHVQRNTFPKSVQHKSSQPPHVAFNGRENSITGGAEEREDGSVYDATGIECRRLHKQLLGQFAALEGVLRRSVERGGVEGSDLEGGEVEEEGAGRRRARGKEQLARSSRTVYNLKQQLQGLVKELDKYHTMSTAAKRTRKAHLVQQLLSLFRSAVRSFNALIRTSTQLEPGEAATGYTKHLSQCQEVGGALKQLTCASLELGVGSQQTTDEVVNRTEAFTALVQELILHHHQHKGPPKGTDEGRKPAPSGPQKGGGGRKRQPPTTKARGVILPLHLRRRIDEKEERRRAAQPAPPSSNWSKETFSFWLKKHFQQEDTERHGNAVIETPDFAAASRHVAVSSSSAVSKTVLPRNRTQPDVSFEAYHRHATKLKPTEELGGEDGGGPLEPQSPSPQHPTPSHPPHHAPSHTSPVGGKRPPEQYCRERRPGDEGRRGVGGAERGEGEQRSEGRLEGAPISSPAWKLMAKELARQIWLDREAVSDRDSKCPGQLSGGGGLSQGRQVSTAPLLATVPAHVGGRKEDLGSFEGEKGVGACGGTGEDSGGRGEVGSEEVGRRASLLMDRPALETMLLRLQEIEEERSRLCHKWSNITYEDPLVSDVVEPLSASRPPDAAAVMKEPHGHHNDIIIEPVAVGQGDTVVSLSSVSKVCPATEDNSDSETNTSEIQQSHVPLQPGRTYSDHGQRGKMVGVSRALRSSIEAYQKQYQQYQRLTCTQAEGDFDPSVLITRVSEAILDDILEELSAEMMAAGDRMAEELFSKEFARPDTPNDVSSSTHSSMPSVVCTTD